MQPADALRDVALHLIREMPVTASNSGVGPAHDPDDEALGDFQEEKHCGGDVTPASCNRLSRSPVSASSRFHSVWVRRFSGPPVDVVNTHPPSVQTCAALSISVLHARNEASW